MNIMVKGNYSGHVSNQVLEAYMSSDLPPRPDYVKELGSISYTDQDGLHAILLLEVDDSKVAEYLDIQGQRNAFLQSRVENLTLEVHVGRSLMESIELIQPHLPQ